MKYICLVNVLILLFCVVSFAQTKKDTSVSKPPTERPLQMPSNLEKRFNPKSTVRLFQEDFTIPLDLKKFSAIMSLDALEKNHFTQEELNSGMLYDEITSFRNNKASTMRMLAEFYGEDLINLQKLLDNIGLTKDQIVAFLMTIKFAFGQALIK